MPRIGHRVHRLEETASTNDEARRLAEEGAPEGLVVVARRQSAGRGREGRAWASPEGGLYFSVVLRPERAPGAWGLLPIAAGVAVHDALSALDVPCRLKWPNDVQVQGRKVAGILAESRVSQARFAIVGVGVNVNAGPHALPSEVASLATSLSEWGGARELEGVLTGILDALEARYRQFEAAADAELLADYKGRLSTLGKVVTVEGREGVAVDVAEDGGLVIEALSDGKREVIRTAP